MEKLKPSDDLHISLLGFLYNNPKHGYELFKEISDLSGIGLVWRIKMGHLYAMLHHLEEEGWIECAVTQAGNRPQRNQYTITAPGKAKFDEWQTEPVNKGRDFRIIFLLKMYFALQHGKRKVHTLISTQKSACEKWIGDLKNNESENELPDFHEIVINFRLTQIKGYLEWLDWCQENLSNPK